MFSSKELTSPDVDEVAYLRYALRASSYSAEQARLQNCISEVQNDIQVILAEHADDLIDQTRCTSHAQREVAAVHQTTDSLQKASGRLRIMIEEPFLLLQRQVKALTATQEVVHLLQSTNRFLSLNAKLHELLSASPPALDIMRAAYTLRELEEVLQEEQVRSVQLVEAQLPTVERYATTIRGKVHELLAMTELTSLPSNPTDASPQAASPTVSISRVATQVNMGLQCSYVLRMLSRTVQGIMTERRREVLRTIMRELDLHVIEERIAGERDRLAPAQPDGQTGSVSEQAVTAHVVLTHIQKTLFIAVQHAQCILLLWRLLLQRRDAERGIPYLSAVDTPVQLLVEFWSTVTEKLRERLNSLQKRHAIRVALASSFPQYHHLMISFLSRTDVAGTTEGSPVPRALSDVVGVEGIGVAGGRGDEVVVASSSSIHVTQCGMGDYLDLIDAVDAAVRTMSSVKGASLAASGKGLSAAVPGEAQDLRQMWLAHVSDEIRGAFHTIVLNRHREVVAGVLSRLSSIIPSSATMAAQSASVAPVRMQSNRHPPVPSQANVLDTASYTRMVLHEMQLFRNDPYTMEVLLDCVLICLRQLWGRLGEVEGRHPLPPLPAVAAVPTLSQMMHLSIANGCTTLAYDCTTVLAMVPQPTPCAIRDKRDGESRAASTSAAACSSFPRPSHLDPYSLVLEQLEVKRMELQRLIKAFHDMSEKLTLPFMHSALAGLLPTLTNVVEATLHQELISSFATAGKAADALQPETTERTAGVNSRAALTQLQSQLSHFLDRFFFLVDVRTSDWLKSCQHMADALLVRVLMRLAVTLPPAARRGFLSVTAPAYARVLQRTMPPLLHFVQSIESAGAGGRTTALMRGCVHQVQGFYEMCGRLGGGGDSVVSAAAASQLLATLKERLKPPVPEYFAKLLLVQLCLFAAPTYISTDESSPATQRASDISATLAASDRAAAQDIEELLLAEGAAGAKAADGEDGTDALSSSSATESRKAASLQVLGARFSEVIEAAPPELASPLREIWGCIDTNE